METMAQRPKKEKSPLDGGELNCTATSLYRERGP
jgi:hypothetical protein